MSSGTELWNELEIVSGLFDLDPEGNGYATGPDGYSDLPLAVSHNEGVKPMLSTTRDTLFDLATHKSVTILLVRPDGIGDEILCLPVASAVRRHLPKARIAFLSSQTAAPILAHHPDIDEIRTVTGQEQFAEIVALFQDIDAAVFLKPFRRLMVAAVVARVPHRVATGFRWYSLLANRRVYQHRADFSRHESEYNLHLLTGLDIEPGPVVRPRLMLTPEERHWALARLADIPQPRIVIHPGGLSARHWQMRHHWDLAKQLLGKGYGVILTGSQAEHERWERECGRSDNLGARVFDSMGQLTIRELMAIIGSSQVVVSGATGPAHMAAALDVPTVSIFDPRRNNTTVRWRPLGKGVLLRPDVPTCEKCIYEACPYWDCLDQITVEEVKICIDDVVERSVWYKSSSHAINA